MKKWLKKVLSSKFSHPTLISVFLSPEAIKHNLEVFRRLSPTTSIAPVLKSNAYGHGLSHIATVVSEFNVPLIIVDSYFEARAVRNEGVTTPLLVIGYSLPEEVISNRLKNISFTITSLEGLKSMCKITKQNISLHLKIDTGMHRQGIMPGEKEEAVKILHDNPHLKLEGICSHLAEAGNVDRSFTERQISEWNGLVKYFKSEFPTLSFWHIANTEGHAHQEAEANIMRLGIGLYGIHGPAELTPVMRIETIITSVRTLAAGESVGYDRTYITPGEMKVATIPFGYYEGFDRRLSNKGCVKINGVYCPIVGNVSMNITSIDVSSISNIKIGDRVVVISDVRTDQNSFEGMSEATGSISYEMVVRISPLLKRVMLFNFNKK